MATARGYDREVRGPAPRRREVDLAHLRFLRWLAVRGCLEHAPAGPSYGVYALADVVLGRPDADALTVQVTLGERPTASRR
jgi:hypothetical protein